jgi:hypothetical protein
MRLSRRLMRWLCRWLVLPLLFMQLAAAAHACATAIAPAGEGVAMTVVPNCHGEASLAEHADPAQLCKAHCAQGHQAVDGAQAGDWTPWPLLVSVIDWRQAAQLGRLAVRRLAGPPLGGAPPGSPPIYLSLLVLRN